MLTISSIGIGASDLEDMVLSDGGTDAPIPSEAFSFSSCSASDYQLDDNELEAENRAEENELSLLELETEDFDLKESHDRGPQVTLHSGTASQMDASTLEEGYASDLASLTESSDEESKTVTKKRCRSDDDNEPAEDSKACRGPPRKRRIVYKTLVLPRDKSAGGKFVTARLKPIKKAIRLLEETFEGGATCFFYCKPKFGEARQVVSRNLAPAALNASMKHTVFINFLEAMSRVSLPIRQEPYTPEMMSWEHFESLLSKVDMACLKKTIRRIAHLIDGI